MDKDPLEIAPETMRQLGYQAVDMLVDWVAQNRDVPLARSASRSEMQQRLLEPSPGEPAAFDEIMTQLESEVLTHMNRGDHPRFFVFVPSCSTWPGALGDFIASACNIYSGSWSESAGPTMLELVVLEWFKQWLGYPSGAGGILLSGGSAANLAALACAPREPDRSHGGRCRRLRLRSGSLLAGSSRACARFPSSLATGAARG